ncbi:hypothetical protein DXA18_12890 [Dorea sp. AM58-8]|nr:hypothetical protein DXA18_12890 [Dorea sp. AM58-8]
MTLETWHLIYIILHIFMKNVKKESETLKSPTPLFSRMPRILAARCASCNCMTYFYCAPLQSCRRLYQMGN